MQVDSGGAEQAVAKPAKFSGAESLRGLGDVPQVDQGGYRDDDPAIGLGTSQDVPGGGGQLNGSFD